MPSNETIHLHFPDNDEEKTVSLAEFIRHHPPTLVAAVLSQTRGHDTATIQKGEHGARRGFYAIWLDDK